MHIVALGSSFAAGPGIEPVVDAEAKRSGRNFPSLLASRLDARLTDLSVSGATLRNILDEPQGSFPPQAQHVPVDADLVLITAGGNDIGYIGGIMRDAMSKSWTGWLLGKAYIAFAGAPSPPATDDEVADRFKRIIERIRQRAPKARILLVEYLTLLGDHAQTSNELPLSSEEIARHQAVGERVQDNFRKAGSASGVEVISVGSPSKSHGVGAPEPWVTGLTGSFLPWQRAGPAPFHPTAEGMQAVADILAEYLQTHPGAP